MNVTLPKHFLVVALIAGIASSNAAVGIPLQVVASSRPASTMGLLLALIPLGTAVGALLTAPIRNRVGNAAATLSQSILVTAIGCLVLMTPITILSLFGGAALVGIGGGMFWVCSQVLLSANSGQHGSESSFLVHFAVYTSGILLGSVLTGALVTVVEASGMNSLAATQLSLVIGSTASIAAYATWWPKRLTIKDAAGRVALGWRILTSGLSLQIPDLFIVATLSIVSLLSPLVLLDTFSFSSFAVGITAGGIAVSKIVGTMLARQVMSAFETRITILAFLFAGLLACAILALTSEPSLFVIALLFASLAITGVWPLVVAAAHTQTLSTLRGDAAVAWNVREYTVIAAFGAVGTWLYATSSRFVMFAAAILLLLLAVGYTARGLYRPPFINIKEIS